MATQFKFKELCTKEENFVFIDGTCELIDGFFYGKARVYQLIKIGTTKAMQEMDNRIHEVCIPVCAVQYLIN
jgi:hypothetical protein